jgi:hypothetical protein
MVLSLLPFFLLVCFIFGPIIMIIGVVNEGSGHHLGRRMRIGIILVEGRGVLLEEECCNVDSVGMMLIVII